MRHTYVIYMGICALLLVIASSCMGGTDPKIEAQYEEQIAGCKAQYSTSIEQDICTLQVNHKYGK